MKKLIMFSVFLTSLCCTIQAFAHDGDRAVIVVTDMLPDDVDAIFALKKYSERANISQILFITADGDVRKKARALHNFTEALGFTNAVVVAGDAEIGAIVPGYVLDYLQTAPSYLDNLESTQIKSKWVDKDKRKEIKRVIDGSKQVEVFLLANPASLIDSLDTINSPQLIRIFAMGLWKSNGNNGFISAYNANTNPVATVHFLKWVQANKLRLDMLPSELFNGLNQVVTQTANARQDLVQRADREPITRSVLEGLVQFRDALTNRLVQQYGMNAGFIFSWDPMTSAWLQDSVTVMAALNPSAVTFQSVNVTADISNIKSSQLGFPFNVTLSPSSTIQLAVSLDQHVVGQRLADAYSTAKVGQPFEPEKELEANTSPILWIGKAANDDVGLLRMMLNMGHRLKMVVTESSNTTLSADVLRTMVDAYGRSDIAVRAGIGQTLDQMKAIPNLGLEVKLLESGWGQNMLNEHAYSVALKKPQGTRAAADIIRFLEAQKIPVEIVVTASVLDLCETLSTRPDLIEKIRTLHLMGGWRTDNGNLTRNWLIETNKVSKLFDLIEKHRLNTYVYSSHLLGGSITKTQVPQTVEQIQNLVREFSIEQAVDELRQEWNRAVPVPGFDVAGNYGPSLAYMMGVMVGLGQDAVTNGYVQTQGVRLQFDANHNVKFEMISGEAGRKHHLKLVGDQAQSSMRIMDQTVAYLFKKAGLHLRNNIHKTAVPSNECLAPLQPK